MIRYLPAFGLAAALGLASCASDPSKGYSFTSTYPSDVRSVTVPVFDNRTYSRGLEVDLTDAIIKQIQRTTPWVVVSASGADTALSGTITSAEMKHLSLTRGTGIVQEQALAITVDFQWRDNRTGQIRVSRQSFSAMDTFVPAPGTSERLEVGQHGAVQELARDIVAELRSNW